MRVWIGALAAVVCASLVLWVAAPARVAARPSPALEFGQARPKAPEFPAGMQWLNTDKPLTIKGLKGKIVLIDFWTYCCINCIHIIPDLKKLEAKYPNELVVIGVHSAKFTNEKESENIRQAIAKYEIEHPVVNDKDMRIWNIYGANSWPSLFLIDPDGIVVGWKAGEGVFEPFDRAIAALIKDFGAKGKLDRKPIKFALEKDKMAKAPLSYPGKIAADPVSGRLFVADSNHNRIVVMSLTGAIQETIGQGSIGLVDGDFKTAKFFRSQGLCFDAAANALYIADMENHAVRKIDLTAKRVTTLAGTGRQAREYPPRAGVGKNVDLTSPWDVLQHGRTLYVAMAGSHQIWTLDLDSLAAKPFAGSGHENITDGSLTASALAQPSGLAFDGTTLYFADSEVSAVRTVGLTSKTVGTLIGMGLFEYGDVDGKYPDARLQHPIGVAWHDGHVYVADTYNHKIKRIDPKTRTLETFIGTGKRGAADGLAKFATLNEPNGMVFVNGKMYIADTNNHAIRVFDPKTGAVSTLKVSAPSVAAASLR